MNIAESETLLQFYENIDVFLIVFIRAMGFFLLLPIMSGQNIPVMARVGLCLGVALLAFTSNAVILPDYTMTLIGFGFFMMQEFVIGILMGFIVMMFFSMFHFVGQLVDFQMGFSMVSVHDPFGRTQTPITGNFYNLIASMFFVFTGALHSVIRVFFESFHITPIGQGSILGNPTIPYTITMIIIQYFLFGLRIAMPVVGTLIVVDIVLGILVKAVPQMNIFVVGIPLKVFIGLIIIFLTLPLLRDAFAFVMSDIIGYLLNILRGMMINVG